MSHPLDGEDLTVEVGQGFLDADFSATVAHVPSGLVGEARGETREAAVAAAKDDLLRLIEEAGGG